MIFRILFLAFIVAPFALLGLPFQLLLLRTPTRAWQVLPRVFFRLLAFGLGLKVDVIGKPMPGPALLLANHISWLDIIALGATLPVRFVAKSDVATYPLVGFFAGLAKTIFVDRTRRADTARTASEMRAALADGDRIVLFPEGTSDIGTHVLPFKSALVGALGRAPAAAQPVAIAYTAISALPLSRHERSTIAWVGDMGLGDNLGHIFASGPKSVSIAFGTPITATEDRKVLTRRAEREVRAMLVALNRREPLPSDRVLM